MQALLNLNTKFRGKELIRQQISFEVESIEHTEMWMGAKIEIERGRTLHSATYALAITIAGETTRYIQTNEEISPDNSLQQAAWLYEHRHLPVMTRAMLCRNELQPESVDQFREFCNVLLNNFIAGEFQLNDINTALHEAVDRLQDQGLVTETGEDCKKLRNGITELHNHLMNVSRSQEVNSVSMMNKEFIEQEGHSVAVIAANELGCATRKAVERVMLQAGHEYLRKASKRFAFQQG